MKTIVLPFSRSDKIRLVDLLSWMLLMGFNRESHGKGIRAVLAHCPLTDCRGVYELAKLAFESVEIFHPHEANTSGWPFACNFLFIKTAEFLTPSKTPFLWFEPDAVPLVPHFIETLFGEYATLKPGMFMGCGRTVRIPHVPPVEVKFIHSAIAIYPDPDSFVGLLTINGAAWDAQISCMFPERLHATDKIHDSGSIGVAFNTILDLRKVRSGAVAYHFDKSPNLIRVLTGRAIGTPITCESSVNRRILPPLGRHSPSNQIPAR
jgi:hypothetical protein